ncbi:hypothetical protein [Nocardia sp. NPDC059239]|uniref:hypothetical protein n=1 Tax=Actinomycetes TaxID=1760 RepID=UPI0036CAB9C4
MSLNNVPRVNCVLAKECLTRRDECLLRHGEAQPDGMVARTRRCVKSAFAVISDHSDDIARAAALAATAANFAALAFEHFGFHGTAIALHFTAIALRVLTCRMIYVLLWAVMKLVIQTVRRIALGIRIGLHAAADIVVGTARRAVKAARRLIHQVRRRA